MSGSIPQGLRAAYRRLPVTLRRRIGGCVTRLVAPALARGVPAAEPGRDGAVRSVLVAGMTRSLLGHGTAARLCAEELRRGGLAVSTLDLGGAVRAPAAPEHERLAGADAGEAGAVVLTLNPEEVVQALHAEQGRALKGRRIAAYWVWELEEAPRRWRRLAGHVPHEIWAPSAFAADALRAVFDQPVFVVPHPCALAPPPAPPPERRAAARRRFGAGEGDFLAVSSFSASSSLARKNPFGAIAAFERVFAGRRDARLVLRCVRGDNYPDAMEALRGATREARAQVTLIDQPGGWDEVLDLYAACDAYLSLHRSEGFGLNLAEAMLSGRPVVATAWSGNLEFMTADCAAMVPPVEIVDVRDPQGIYRGPGRWADPNLDAAADHLRALAADPDARARLGAAGEAYAMSRLRGGAAVRRLLTPGGDSGA